MTGTLKECSEFIVHAIIKCNDCDWKTEDYRTAQCDAMEHAMKHGHTVTGEIGLTVKYVGGKRGV